MMLSVTSILSLLLLLTLNRFSFVEGCSDSSSCGRSVESQFTKDVNVLVLGLHRCKCAADKLCTRSVIYTDDLADWRAEFIQSDALCRRYCCEVCKDTSRRKLQESGKNEVNITDRTSVEESNGTISSGSDPVNPVCICYGAPDNDDSCPLFPPANFAECSDQCNSTCFINDVSSPIFGYPLAGCEVSPLFIDENITADKNMAKNLMSEWRASSISGNICVCEEKGFMIGTNNITDFQKVDCTDFCSQADYFGGVRDWLTADEATSPPISSPTEDSKPNTSFGPAWAIAVFTVVVSVGLLMLIVLFCKPDLGSRSG